LLCKRLSGLNVLMLDTDLVAVFDLDRLHFNFVEITLERFLPALFMKTSLSKTDFSIFLESGVFMNNAMH